MLYISLAAARVNAELKQDEAAKLIGVTSKTLSLYERGISVIPGRVLQRAAKVYNVPSDYIRLPNMKDGSFDDVDISSVV